MAGMTSTLVGIVRVPLFDTGIATGGVSFDGSSYGPVYNNGEQGINGDSGNVDGPLSWGVATLAMVGGEAKFDFGTFNQPGSQNLNTATYFDGVWHASTNVPVFLFNIVHGVIVQAAFQRLPWHPKPTVTTVIPAGPTGTLQDTLFATNKGYVGRISPANYLGNKAECQLYSTNANLLSGLTIRYRNAFQQNVLFPMNPGPGFFAVPVDASGLGANGAQIRLNRMSLGAQSIQSANSAYDNCLFQAPSHQFTNFPGHVVWMSTFNPGITISMELHLDNPFLENLFTNVASDGLHGPFAGIFPFGFLYTLFANGAGPTGQLTEYLVFNSDCSQYFLINFIPQDVSSQNLLAQPAFPEFAIDEQGIVWVGSAGFSHLSYSFSPSGFNFPIIQAPPLNPFVLPCYNTCSPVAIIDH